MDVKDYCKAMETELITWKAKIYDALRKLEELPEEERKKFLEEIKFFNKTIKEIEDRLEKLRFECPSDWSEDKKVIEAKKSQLEEAWYKYWSQIRY